MSENDEKEKLILEGKRSSSSRLDIRSSSMNEFHRKRPSSSRLDIHHHSSMNDMDNRKFSKRLSRVPSRRSQADMYESFNSADLERTPLKHPKKRLTMTIKTNRKDKSNSKRPKDVNTDHESTDTEKLSHRSDRDKDERRSNMKQSKHKTDHLEDEMEDETKPPKSPAEKKHRHRFRSKHAEGDGTNKEKVEDHSAHSAHSKQQNQYHDTTETTSLKDADHQSIRKSDHSSSKRSHKSQRDKRHGKNKQNQMKYDSETEHLSDLPTTDNLDSSATSKKNKERQDLKREPTMHFLGSSATTTQDDTKTSSKTLLNWEPYKQNVIDKIIENAQSPHHPDGYDKITEQLTDYGITVYEIGYISKIDGANMIQEIKNVARDVSNQIRTYHGLSERCLLYRDKHGRLFNITRNGGSSGLYIAWKSSLAKFSGFEAMVALTILSRSFGCAMQDTDMGVRPAYLSLLLGLVLSDEIALSHLNVVMLVWGAPSVSSYELLMHFSSDWPSKLIILILAVAGASPTMNPVQKYMTIFGVGLACCVLAANLGSRAWFNLKLRPLAYSGPGFQLVAAIFAIATGLTAPYMGYREVVTGGQVAFVTVLESAFMVAAVFIFSDFDDVQTLIISGSEECTQDTVNMMVGMWWSLSLLVSLFLCGRIKRFAVRRIDDDSHPILDEAHDSPVGYKVRNLPDYPVQETEWVQPKNIFSILFLRLLGVFMAVVGGFIIVYLAITDIDDELTGV